MAHSTAESNRDLLLEPQFNLIREEDAARMIEPGDLIEIRINGEVLTAVRAYKPMFIDRVKLLDIQNDRGFRRGIGLHLGRKKVS
jgi:hypothetical protein